MKPLLCQICEEEVGLGGELLPTGPVCVICAGKEPQAPTNNPNEGGESAASPATEGADNSASHAPRAAEEHTESKGEPAPPAAGDRAQVGPTITEILAEAGDVDVAHLRPFARPETREIPSLVVEEWIFGAVAHAPHLSLLERLVLVRSPREVHHRQDLVNGLEVCRFVVVMEWRQYAGQFVDFRDIGPSFTPRAGSRADRAAALNTAKAWANGECRRQRLAFPTFYRAARELPDPPRDV